jgi:hypothetical protein
MTEERIQEVLRCCEEKNIKVKRMRITMEDLTPEDEGYFSRKAAKSQNE